MKTTKAVKHYYAECAPRGFANEIRTYRFSSRRTRDSHVARFAGSGWLAITTKEAQANVNYRGDACTDSYNSPYIDIDDED